MAQWQWPNSRREMKQIRLREDQLISTTVPSAPVLQHGSGKRELQRFFVVKTIASKLNYYQLYIYISHRHPSRLCPPSSSFPSS